MPKKIFFLIVIGIAALNASAEDVRIRLVKDLESFPTIAKAKTTVINNHLWSVQGKNLFFKGKKLSNTNLIVENKNQSYDIIGQFDFDHYLAGVVASEMPDRWPTEALNAQAIVARSFAMARINERKDKIFQLDSDQMDQVFRTTESKPAFDAVMKTKHIVLRNQNGQILKAFFHADCGGQTIPASKVWNTEIDTGTAVDPWCSKRKSNEWSFEMSEKQFLKSLKQAPQSEVGISSIFAQKIQGIQVGSLDYSIQKLRQIFGFSRIKNSPEVVQIENDKIILKGNGYGHGVGLCQWGTLEQAKRGFTALQIIRHYYPKALISEGETRVNLVSR